MSKQNTVLASTLQICLAGCRQTACVLWVCPSTDPRLNWLSQGVNGFPASSCGLGVTVKPMALSPSVHLHVRDTIMSVLLVLKSTLVDVEDFDGVVSARAGKLEPGALLLDFTLCIRQSIFLAVLTTDLTSPGPPAESFDRQRMALPVKVYMMKGNNKILLWVTEQAAELLHIIYWCTFSNTNSVLNRQIQTSLLQCLDSWMQKGGEKYPKSQKWKRQKGAVKTEEQKPCHSNTRKCTILQ